MYFSSDIGEGETPQWLAEQNAQMEADKRRREEELRNSKERQDAQTKLKMAALKKWGIQIINDEFIPKIVYLRHLLSFSPVLSSFPLLLLMFMLFFLPTHFLKKKHHPITEIKQATFRVILMSWCLSDISSRGFTNRSPKSSSTLQWMKSTLRSLMKKSELQNN